MQEKVKCCTERSMVVEGLMSDEAGAQASIRPSKAPSSLGKCPRNLARLPLQVDFLVGRNLTVVRN